MLRYSLIALTGLLVASCGDAGPKQQVSAAIGPAKWDAVPQEILGSWKYVREECEDDVTPSKKIPQVTITFQRDFSYELNVEGWAFSGVYQLQRLRDVPLSIQLKESMYEFDWVDNRLENWSEGDAVYICGRIFERVN